MIVVDVGIFRLELDEYSIFHPRNAI